MNSTRIVAAALCSMSVWIIGGGLGNATGIFNLDSPGAFQAAIDDGLLRPTTAWDAGMEFAFPGEIGSFVPSSLSTDSLGLSVSVLADMPVDDFAWDYTIATDADYTNLMIRKRIIVPPLAAGTTAKILIQMKDVNGKMKQWDEGVAAGGAVDLDLAAKGDKQGLDSFKVDPDFDITKVTAIKDLVQYIQPKDVSVPLNFEETNFSALPVSGPPGLLLLGVGLAVVAALRPRGRHAGKMAP